MSANLSLKQTARSAAVEASFSWKRPCSSSAGVHFDRCFIDGVSWRRRVEERDEERDEDETCAGWDERFALLFDLTIEFLDRDPLDGGRVVGVFNLDIRW